MNCQDNMKTNYLVGAAAIIIDPASGEILLTERQGRWSIPGGTAEPHETMSQVVAREIREEVTLDLPAERYPVTRIYERVKSTGRWKDVPYLMAYCLLLLGPGERERLINAEPDRCKEIRWFKRSELPEAEMSAFDLEALRDARSVLDDGRAPRTRDHQALPDEMTHYPTGP